MNFEPSIVNADSHFAPGDIASWSGIKRCGAAIMMGHLTSVNIHQLIIRSPEEQSSHTSSTAPIEFAEFPRFPPMIALAVGRKAATYSAEGGVGSSEDLMKACFGDDLGWTIIWDCMMLGTKIEVPVDVLADNLGVQGDIKEADLVVKTKEIIV